MIFRIEPKPTPEEAAAIEIAIKRLMLQGQVTTRRLRYRDVLDGRAGSTATYSTHGRASSTSAWTTPDDLVNSSATWRDMARIELLDPGV